MAKAWFTYKGDQSHDGPTDPSNYQLIRMQPDYFTGSEIGAIYAEIQIYKGKMKPYIDILLQTEIVIAKLTAKPSPNVLLKPE